MRRPTHPNITSIELSSVLYALSDPVRLKIVKCLDQNSDQTCGEIDVDVANSTKSYHMKILRESGIIKMCAKGKERYASLRREELNTRFPDLLTSVLEAV